MAARPALHGKPDISTSGTDSRADSASAAPRRSEPVDGDAAARRLEVAGSADVPARGGLAVRVGEVEIGLFRTDAGFLAIENACPHAGVPLSSGDVADCIVTCPAHGFQYDLRTGYAADYADGFPIPRFEVIEAEGGLWLVADVEDDGTLSPRPMKRVAPGAGDRGD